MVSFDDAISVLKDNAGFKPNNYDDSYYRLYETSKGCIQVRVSNHGTELWTWVKNAPINPSDCYANICIVLSDDGNHASDTTADMNIYKKDESGKDILDFEVIQYVYNLSLLSSRNMGIINAMIQQIPTKNKFYEPLRANPTKHAKIFKLTPNKRISVV